MRSTVSDSFPPPVPPASSTPTPAPPPPGSGYAAPSGAYTVPVGGYQSPVGAYQVPPEAPTRSRATGAAALVASLIAAVIASIIAGILALRIGLAVSVDDLVDTSGTLVLAALSPVRIETLWAEIMFWLGTALGVLALVAGIIAIVRRRGRGLGIAAVVIAALGPGLFFLAVSIMYGIGNGIATDPLF